MAKTFSLNISVRPNSPRTLRKAVLSDGTWKVDIAAPPEDGKANRALIAFLAEEFGVAKSAVEILSGHTAKRKVVSIRTS